MRALAVLLALSLCVLSIPLHADGSVEAEVGVQLARSLASYALAELFRQRLGMWRLSGGQAPSPTPAIASLEDTARHLSAMESGLQDLADWADVVFAVQTASHTIGQALVALTGAAEAGLAELTPQELDDLSQILARVRKALDELVLKGSETAEKVGEGWEFQVAFLCQTVLLSPSPLYLRVQEEWAAYLRRNVPPETAPEAVSSLERLLSLANRGLTEDEEAEAREAAQTLLNYLAPEEAGGGG